MTQEKEKAYILEVGCEEIPARFLSNFAQQLRDAMEATFKKNRIIYDQVEWSATYRRLVIVVKNCLPKQMDLSEEILGPPVMIAFSADKKALPPAIGFAKRMGVPVGSLRTKTNNGKTVMMGKKVEKGKKVTEVIPTLVPAILRQLKLPIGMRWGAEKEMFIRPVHWILSVYDNQVVPFTVFGVTANRYTYGHRFLTKASNKNEVSTGVKLKLKTADEYETVLEKEGNVISNVQKRQKIIREYLKKEKQIKVDEGLLEEVTYLVEYPYPITCCFETEYLKIPEPILGECMKKHQKYFPIYKQSKLTESFIVVADNVTKENKGTIIEGNERVLTARLKDAQFFWQADQQVSFKLRIQKLKGVVFQKNLGSIFEKKERIKTMALWCNQCMGGPLSESLIKESADYCKADLVSHLVVEFPSLQGQVGQLLANQQNLDPEIGTAIREHYLPQQYEGECPKTSLGSILAVADRLDTIVCCFENKLIPTGSQDPWGVRRAILGIIAILQKGVVNISLEEGINEVYKVLKKPPIHKADIIDFIKQRIKGIYSTQYPYDIVESILDHAMIDLKDAETIAKAMSRYKKEDAGAYKTLTETAVRIKRLAQKEKGERVNESLFVEPAEKKAWDSFKKTERTIQDLLTKGQTERVIEPLADLTCPMTQYFDEILVMDKDKKIRANRFAFLNQCDSLYARVANFEYISV